MKIYKKIWGVVFVIGILFFVNPKPALAATPTPIVGDCTIDLRVATNSANWLDSLSGPVPFNGVDVRGTMTPPFSPHYLEFDCTNNGTAEWSTPLYIGGFQQWTVDNLCNYSSAGDYIIRATAQNYDTATNRRVGAACSDFSLISVSSFSSPTANSGPAHALTVGVSHTHSGASATDPDGNLSSYNWSLFSCPGLTCPTLSGSGGALSGGSATIPGPTYTPNAAGNYVLRLLVGDTTATFSISDVTENAVTAPISTFNLSCTNNCGFASASGTNPVNQTLSITNTGGSSITWTVARTQSWLTLSPTSGSTAAGGTSNITVSINSAGLIAGNYTDTITATSGGTSETMSVGLSVGEPLTIIQSLWRIFQKPNLTTAVQAATLLGKTNYTASGLPLADYQASLQITNSANQTASAVKDFSVISANSPPSVSSVTITQPNYCVSGPAAMVNWIYSDPEGQPQSAFQVQVDDIGSAWNSPFTIDSDKVLGSGTSYFTNNGIPPWAWNTAYRARVRVWDSQDAVSNWRESSSWTTPRHAYPNVDFGWSPLEPSINQTVQFTDLTQFFDTGGTGQRGWGWLFGDGGSSALQNPTHTYSTVGSYNVTETATDSDGYSCSRTKILGVQRPIPIWKEVSPR